MCETKQVPWTHIYDPRRLPLPWQTPDAADSNAAEARAKIKQITSTSTTSNHKTGGRRLPHPQEADVPDAFHSIPESLDMDTLLGYFDKNLDHRIELTTCSLPSWNLDPDWQGGNRPQPHQQLLSIKPSQMLLVRGGLKDLQMDTMITKWEVGKIWEVPPPHPT